MCKHYSNSDTSRLAAEPPLSFCQRLPLQMNSAHGILIIFSAFMAYSFFYTSLNTRKNLFISQYWLPKIESYLFVLWRGNVVVKSRNNLTLCSVTSQFTFLNKNKVGNVGIRQHWGAFGSLSLGYLSHIHTFESTGVTRFVVVLILYIHCTSSKVVLLLVYFLFILKNL